MSGEPAPPSASGADRPRLRTAILRGLRRRCPRCGIGTLSAGWFALRERCPSCALRLEHSPGDTWGFWVLLDRVFVFVPIVILYVGLAPSALWQQILFFAALIGLLIATMPHRQGVGVALDYLVRAKAGETGDPS